MEFGEVVRRRRMVRSYRADAVDPDALDRILTTALRAPSAGFAQPHRFVVVTDPDRRRLIAAACGEPAAVGRGLPPWLSTAPVHVVPCVDRSAYDRRYESADKAASAGPAGWEVPFWWVDGGAALMLLLLAAVDEGLAAGFLDVDRERICEAAGVPEGWTPLGLVTIGHPAADDRPVGSAARRARLPMSQVIARR